MLTGDENIVELQFFVKYRIQDPIKFLFGANDPEGILHTSAEVALRSAVGRSRRRSIVRVPPLGERLPAPAMVKLIFVPMPPQPKGRAELHCALYCGSLGIIRVPTAVMAGRPAPRTSCPG